MSTGRAAITLFAILIALSSMVSPIGNSIAGEKSKEKKEKKEKSKDEKKKDKLKAAEKQEKKRLKEMERDANPMGNLKGI